MYLCRSHCFHFRYSEDFFHLVSPSFKTYHSSIIVFDSLLKMHIIIVLLKHDIREIKEYIRQCFLILNSFFKAGFPNVLNISRWVLLSSSIFYALLSFIISSAAQKFCVSICRGTISEKYMTLYFISQFHSPNDFFINTRLFPVIVICSYALGKLEATSLQLNLSFI